MKLFATSLTTGGAYISPLIPYPTNLIYQSGYDKVSNDSPVGVTSHIQGVCYVPDENILFVSHTNKLLKYDWDTMSLLASSSETFYHLGDITYLNGKIYGASAIDGFAKISPATNKVVEFDIDCNVLRSVESEFSHSIGAMGNDGINIWAGYGNELVTDGIIQRIKLSDLKIDSGFEELYPAPNGDNSFGNGTQAIEWYNGKLYMMNYSGANSVFGISNWMAVSNSPNKVECKIEPSDGVFGYGGVLKDGAWWFANEDTGNKIRMKKYLEKY